MPPFWRHSSRYAAVLSRINAASFMSDRNRHGGAAALEIGLKLLHVPQPCRRRKIVK
jgi:hypothetical protein